MEDNSKYECITDYQHFVHTESQFRIINHGTKKAIMVGAMLTSPRLASLPAAQPNPKISKVLPTLCSEISSFRF